MEIVNIYQSSFLKEVIFYLDKNKIEYEFVDKKDRGLIEIFFQQKNIFFWHLLFRFGLVILK
jgi:hypothetical protein